MIFYPSCSTKFSSNPSKSFNECVFSKYTLVSGLLIRTIHCKVLSLSKISNALGNLDSIFFYCIINM